MDPFETIPPGEHVEHGWLLPDAFDQLVVINTWREGGPEGRKPPDMYRPEKVTRVIGVWRRDDQTDRPERQHPVRCLVPVREAIHDRLYHPDGRRYDGSESYPLRLTMVDENGAWAGEVKPIDDMVPVRPNSDGPVERTQADHRHEPHPLDPWVTHASAAEVAEFIRHGNKPTPGVSSTSLPSLDVLRQTAKQSRGTPFVSDGPYVTPQPDGQWTVDGSGQSGDLVYEQEGQAPFHIPLADGDPFNLLRRLVGRQAEVERAQRRDPRAGRRVAAGYHPDLQVGDVCSRCEKEVFAKWSGISCPCGASWYCA